MMKKQRHSFWLGHALLAVTLTMSLLTPMSAFADDGKKGNQHGQEQQGRQPGDHKSGDSDQGKKAQQDDQDKKAQHDRDVKAQEDRDRAAAEPAKRNDEAKADTGSSHNDTDAPGCAWGNDAKNGQLQTAPGCDKDKKDKGEKVEIAGAKDVDHAKDVDQAKDVDHGKDVDVKQPDMDKDADRGNDVDGKQPRMDNDVDQGNDHVKVGVCHATGSATNPFVFIVVDQEGAENGHAKHADDIFGVTSADQCPKGEVECECAPPAVVSPTPTAVPTAIPTAVTTSAPTMVPTAVPTVGTATFTIPAGLTIVTPPTGNSETAETPEVAGVQVPGTMAGAGQNASASSPEEQVEQPAAMSTVSAEAAQPEVNAAAGVPSIEAMAPVAAPAPVTTTQSQPESPEVAGVMVPGQRQSVAGSASPNITLLPFTGRPLLDLGLLGAIPALLAGAGLAVTRLARRRR